MLKKLGRHPLVVSALGNLMAWYLRFVRRTSTFHVDPPDFYELKRNKPPYIICLWHGQHFLVPFARPKHWVVKVMISKSADGEINAIAASKLGMGVIRGSGAQRPGQIAKRGGMRGFIEAIKCMREGHSFSMTADVPKGPARKVGRGMVLVAKHSGTPILPVAIATSRHYDFNSWDKASLNLPFSKMCMAVGDEIQIPSDLPDEQVPEYQRIIEDAMNAVTDKAYSMAKDRSN
ncbi:lysophospholipid acyltransferase family protein [Flexibacterium corallicola]|uniref:lysophospholipid acyltransferase family protein n=1 Tax=Flexibacterium corallicola TaxID=3037259 RepID=UPI00286F5C9E|nr:lysophospholipid acyltransferase family protein [Pseudovibrio sp. M1P-2-3]